MEKIAPLYCILYFLVSVNLCSAQESWTLDKCIEYGISHSLDIESGQLDAQISDNLHLMSKLEITPSLNMHITHTILPERCITPIISSSMTLFSGFEKYYRIKEAEISSRISEAHIGELKTNLALSITSSYINAMMAQEMIKISRKNLCSIEGQYLKCRIWYDNGKITKSTLMEIASQMSAEKVNLISAENLLTISKTELAHLIEIPLSENMVLDTAICNQPLRLVSVCDIDSIFRLALQLPSIEVTRQSIELYDYASKRATGALLPSLSIDATYDLKSNSGGCGFTLNIPIFNHYGHTINIRNTKHELEKRKLALEQKYKSLYKEISNIVHNAISYYQAYIAATDYSEYCIESFNEIQNKFNSGFSNATDYNISKNNMIKAELERIKAKYKYILQCKIIEIYEGEKA